MQVLPVAFILITYSWYLKNRFGIDAALISCHVNPASIMEPGQTFQLGKIVKHIFRSQLINTTSAVFSKRFNELHELTGAYWK